MSTQTSHQKNSMTEPNYQPFIINSIGGFKCRDIVFGRRYNLIQLDRSSWDQCSYVADVFPGGNTSPLTKWRIHKNGDYIKLYWPKAGETEWLYNGINVHIIFLKYRTIFRCIVRLMMLKKRAQARIKARKNLRIANLFRGIGNSNLNPHILAFV